MKLATVTLLAALATASAHAQVPHIVGTWTLDRGRTVYPGPLPEIDIRQYRMSEDGWLVGLAMVVFQGNVNFLQVTSKEDGRDYAEHTSQSLADLQKGGAETPLSFSETRKDERTVEWIDKVRGRATLRGTRSVSEDGKVLTIMATTLDPANPQTFMLVYTRQEPDQAAPR
jgi:hypothetical protein